jgi:hypothetical protein
MENLYQEQVVNNIIKELNQLQQQEILFVGLDMSVFVMELVMLFILIMLIIISEKTQLLMFLNGMEEKF